MIRFRFAIYPPEAPDMPWLVTFESDRVTDAFPCPSRKAAERVLASMRARCALKTGRGRPAMAS